MVPNMVIAAPSDEAECRLLLSTGYQYAGPAAVRYPRGAGTGAAPAEQLDTVELGKARVVRRGSDLAMLVFGAPLREAREVADEFNATLVDMRFIKPLDTALLGDLAASHHAFVTIEDNALAGGAGSAVGEWLAGQGMDLPVLHLGLPDRFLEHGSREELLRDAGLDADGIRQSIRARFPQLALRHTG